MAWFSWQQAKELDPSLSAVEAYFMPLPAKAQTVTGGLTNRCWRIEDIQGNSYVWRPFSAICQAFSISRYSEYQVLNAIQPMQLAPAPVLVNEKGLLVEWVEGETCTHRCVDTDSLLKTMIKIHEFDAVSIPAQPFSFTARVDHYWMQLSSELRTPEVEALYQQLRVAPTIPDVEPALCHFDLGCYNLVKGHFGLKVIDWEYAALADPRLDLVLSIQIAELPLFDTVLRYCQLRDIDDVDAWIEGARHWQPRAMMMAILWYLVAYQLWGDQAYRDSADALLSKLCAH